MIADNDNGTLFDICDAFAQFAETAHGKILGFVIAIAHGQAKATVVVATFFCLLDLSIVALTLGPTIEIVRTENRSADNNPVDAQEIVEQEVERKEQSIWLIQLRSLRH